MVNLTVWACPGFPAQTVEDVVLWQQFLPEGAPASWVSLPERVHLHSDTLRSHYQVWLSGVAQSPLDGAHLAERMVIRPDLSYWWMTLPTDNSLAVHSPAYCIVRLFALAEEFESFRFNTVRVVADRRDVADAIAAWARRLCSQVDVEVIQGGRREPESERHRVRGPHLAATRVFWNHLGIALRHGRKAGRAPFQEGITFVDYLSHLGDPGPGGAFRSNYWGPLVEVLDEWCESVNWLHVSAEYATPSAVMHDIARTKGFNRAGGSHSVLHSYLGLGTVTRALRDYLRIRQFGTKLKRNREVFIDASTGLDPSPLLSGLIDDQYFGRTAALNAFWINLWQSALDKWPHQRLCFYLFENQPWEQAFIASWQGKQQGRLAAVSHSTMLFWDLRYFSGSWSDTPRPFGPGQPNAIVVNGALMLDAASAGGYPKSILAVAEALRFPFTPQNSSNPSTDVLVLGEYESAQDDKLIALVQKWETESETNLNIVFRPHPVNESVQRALPHHWSQSLHTSASAAIADSRLAVCGPTTSAALEARLIGRNVVVAAHAQGFNASPAMKLPNVYVAHAPEQVSFGELSTSLVEIAEMPPETMCRDPHLTRWRQLLKKPPESA